MSNRNNKKGHSKAKSDTLYSSASLGQSAIPLSEVKDFFSWLSVGFKPFQANYFIWKITHDFVKHKFLNETSRRINRNLCNQLTVDANAQTEFKLVKQHSASNMIFTHYLWDYWMRMIPARMQSKQINELVTAILAADMQPKRAVSILNYHFQQMNILFCLSRVGNQRSPGP